VNHVERGREREREREREIRRTETNLCIYLIAGGSMMFLILNLKKYFLYNKKKGKK